MCFQVTARDAVLVATAQPITKDVADSLAHTALIHSKSFAKRRSAALPHVHLLYPKQAHIFAASTQHHVTCKEVKAGWSVMKGHSVHPVAAVTSKLPGLMNSAEHMSPCHNVVSLSAAALAPEHVQLQLM